MRTASYLLSALVFSACASADGELTASRTSEGFGCGNGAFQCGWEAVYQPDGAVTITSLGNTVETRAGMLTDVGRHDRDALIDQLPITPDDPDFNCADIPLITFTVQYDASATTYKTMREGCEPHSAATNVGEFLHDIESAIIDPIRNNCASNPRVICQ